MSNSDSWAYEDSGPGRPETRQPNLWADVQKARAEINATMEQLQPLLKTLPPGRENLAIATALAHVCAAGAALQFREPAVPCRLAFVTLST